MNEEITPQQQQAEPVAWDKPSASFDEWWDSDRRRDSANPFQTDSFAYWAWEGWQAALAQRQWVGLTDEEIKEIHNASVGKDVGFATGLTEAKLKERNT